MTIFVFYWFVAIPSWPLYCNLGHNHDHGTSAWFKRYSIAHVRTVTAIWVSVSLKQALLFVKPSKHVTLWTHILHTRKKLVQHIHSYNINIDNIMV